jgi:hypothetical protein
MLPANPLDNLDLIPLLFPPIAVGIAFDALTCLESLKMQVTRSQMVSSRAETPPPKSINRACNSI